MVGSSVSGLRSAVVVVVVVVVAERVGIVRVGGSGLRVRKLVVLLGTGSSPDSRRLAVGLAGGGSPWTDTLDETFGRVAAEDREKRWRGLLRGGGEREVDWRERERGSGQWPRERPREREKREGVGDGG